MIAFVRGMAEFYVVFFRLDDLVDHLRARIH